MWIAFGASITLVAFVAYVAAQQHIRSDANHPQVELARTAAANLDAGASPQSVVPLTAIDIANSESPYLMVVASDGNLLATSATLDGSPTAPPSGVFDYVRDHGEDVITWQPAPGVRSAIVVDSFRGGFVVAGRSLKSAEDDEATLTRWALAGWLLAVVAVAVFALLRERPSRSN